jgi:hypothetical protein
MEKVVGKPEITEKEYQERVKEIAESILEIDNHNDDIPLEERIHEMVCEHRMATHYHSQKIPIAYHQNEPADLEAFINGTDNLTTTLAFACLLTDVREEVYTMKEEK